MNLISSFLKILMTVNTSITTTDANMGSVNSSTTNWPGELKVGKVKKCPPIIQLK